MPGMFNNSNMRPNFNQGQQQYSQNNNSLEGMFRGLASNFGQLGNRAIADQQNQQYQQQYMDQYSKPNYSYMNQGQYGQPNQGQFQQGNGGMGGYQNSFGQFGQLGQRQNQADFNRPGMQPMYKENQGISNSSPMNSVGGMFRGMGGYMRKAR